MICLKMWEVVCEVRVEAEWVRISNTAGKHIRYKHSCQPFKRNTPLQIEQIECSIRDKPLSGCQQQRFFFRPVRTTAAGPHPLHKHCCIGYCKKYNNTRIVVESGGSGQPQQLETANRWCNRLWKCLRLAI
jgi:hypothetical protein